MRAWMHMCRLSLAIFSAPVRSYVTFYNIDNGVGRTPLLGYSTWNHLMNRCSASTIKQIADALVDKGFKDAGYEYLNIDDCWTEYRRNPVSHVLQGDLEGRTWETKNDEVPADQGLGFPHGMKEVADYVHGKGLKFGLYTDRGDHTCEGRAGSGGYEELDAQTFADWGVDFLKVDSCSANHTLEQANHAVAFNQYKLIRDALNKTGRPIYLGLCGWAPWFATEGEELGNSWRVAGDVQAWGVIWNTVAINSQLARYAGPGGFNDPDSLIGSSQGAHWTVTPTQSRTQFSLWAMMAAPLILGANVLDISDWDLETYTNKEVIALNQDPMGVQGTLVWSTCPNHNITEVMQPVKLPDYDFVAEQVSKKDCSQVWKKPLQDGSVGVMFLVWGSREKPVLCDKACLELMGFAGPVKVRDLWTHSDIGTFNGSVELTANPSRTLKFSATVGESTDNHQTDATPSQALHSTVHNHRFRGRSTE